MDEPETSAAALATEKDLKNKKLKLEEEKQKIKEKELLISLWEQKEDHSIIIETATKGNHINTCINFLANRKKLSLVESKDYYLKEVFSYCYGLVEKGQFYKAEHIFKHVDKNYIHFLYQIYNETDDETKPQVMAHLLKYPEFEAMDRRLLEDHYRFFSLIRNNLDKVALQIDKLNAQYGGNFKPSLLLFHIFMKQNALFHQRLAIDLAFKTKDFQPFFSRFLDKEVLWLYLLKSDLFSLIKAWIKEQLKKRNDQNKEVKDTPAGHTFETDLNNLFYEFDIDKPMAEQLGRYKAGEKDLILNEMAKFGFFVPKEEKNICKFLQRIFTSKTLDENFSSIKFKEVASFILQNNLVDLLCETDLVSFEVLKSCLDDCSYMINAEVELVLAIKHLLAPTINLRKLYLMSHATTQYLEEIDKDFKKNNKLITLFEDFSGCVDLNKTYLINSNFWKVFTQKAPEQDIVRIFQKYHNVNMGYMVREINNHLEKSSEGERLIELPNFDNQHLHKKFSTNYQMTCNDYIRTYGSSNIALYKYLLANHVLKDENRFAQLPRIVADMTAANFEKSDGFSTHSIAFIEMLGFDSSNFRKFLRFMRLRNQKNENSFELSENQEANFTSLRNIEAVNDFHGQAVPAYLRKIMQDNDWFKMILLGQYLNFPTDYFLDICFGNFENKFVERNLIRAISSEANSKTKSQKLFERGKFLDRKMHRDLFSVLLLSGCRNQEAAFDLTVPEFLEMHESSDSDYSDLLKLSISFNDDGECEEEGRGWPLLSILAAMTNTYSRKYCWLNYLILTSNYSLNENFTDFFLLAKDVSNWCVTNKCHLELLHSVQIFYPESNFVNLVKFFSKTLERKFSSAVENLQKFVDSMEDETWIFETEARCMEFSSSITLAHLKFNFQTTLDIYNVLTVLCKTKAYFLKINFHFLKRIFNILREILMQISFNWLKQENYNQSLCDRLVEFNNFTIAIQLADLLKLKKEGIVYGKWMSSYEKEGSNFDFKKCQQDLEEFKIDADIMVKFYLFVAGQVEIGKNKEKYLMLKKALDAIKSHGLHPSDTFDRDQIEYDLTILYLRLTGQELKELPMYYSEYYEVVGKENRKLIFHSFMELREFAQIDDLKIVNQVLTDQVEIEKFNDLIGRLLDDGDFVQCLRFQAMFGQCPVDLNLVVFILALVENLTSLTELPKEERHVICEPETSVTSRSRKMNYRWKIEKNPPENSTSNAIDRDSFIENIVAIQGLIEKMFHGVDIAMRAFLMYRAAYHTGNPYLTLLKTQNITELLEMLTANNCPNKIMMIHDIMVTNCMSPEEISEFLAAELFKALAFCRYGLQLNVDSDETSPIPPKLPQSDKMWGFYLENDFHLLLELTPKSGLLGENLLVYYDMFDYYRSKIYFTGPMAEAIHENMEQLYLKMHSLKKQNTIRIELLIKAHECFVKECSMEGIGKCLERARDLTTILATAKSFGLIVRLLYGIGRYREMYYCFDILIKNDEFEVLLGQFGEKYNTGLKNSLITYLNEHHPQNKEYYNMVISHFSMHFEMAQKWRNEAKLLKVDLIENEVITTSSFEPDTIIPHLICSKELVDVLYDAMGKLMNAAEFYLLDNRVEIAQKVATQAELFALQISLAKKAMALAKNTKSTCISLINVGGPILFRYFVNYELNVQQALILSRAYDTEIDWKQVIFIQFVKLGNEGYLRNYLNVKPLTDHMIEKIAKMYQLETSVSREMEKNISEIVELTQNIVLKFKLATMLGLKPIVSTLMNSPGVYYLKDTNYGRQELL